MCVGPVPELNIATAVLLIDSYSTLYCNNNNTLDARVVHNDMINSNNSKTLDVIIAHNYDVMTK